MHRVTPAFSLILLALWSYWSAVIVLLVLVAIGLWRLLIIWQDYVLKVLVDQNQRWLR